MPIEMTFDPDLQEVLARVEQAQIKVSENLDALHPLVKRTRDGLFAASRTTKDNVLLRPACKEPVLNVAVSRSLLDRAYKTLDSLIRALEDAGFRVTGSKVIGYGKTFQLRFREKTSQVRNKPKPGASKLDMLLAPKVIYFPNGTLGVEIGNDFNAWSTHRAVWETKTRPIETLVPQVVLSLVMAVQEHRNNQAAKAATERQKADEQRQSEEAARLAAETQERRNRRQAREEALLQVAERWKRCALLREFAEAVRAVAVEEVGAADADPKVARWLAWAERVAEKHDPLVRFRRSAPGRRRPR
jgi:hypothetical protein